MGTCSSTIFSKNNVLLFQQENIQKILLALSQSVSDALNPREKIRLLCAYRMFVLLLLQDLNTGLHQNWAFVIRHVIYRCTNLIEEQWSIGDVSRNDSLFPICFDILERLCEAALVVCYEVCQFLFNLYHSFAKLLTAM